MSAMAWASSTMMICACAIAADSGGPVVDFPWWDSFAAARNESLRHARKRKRGQGRMALPLALTGFGQTLSGLLPGDLHQRILLGAPFADPGFIAVGTVAD